MRFHTPLVLFLGLAGAPAAVAVPLTFGFTGVVLDVPVDDPGTGIAAGDLFSGQYTFDGDAVDAIPGAAQASYPSSGLAFGISVQIGASTFSLPGALSIGISNDVLGLDQYSVFASDGVLEIALLLEDLTGAVFASDALPLLPPALAVFAERGLALNDTSGGDLQVQGTLTSLTCLSGCATVPSPATSSLLAIALLAGAWPRRRQD